MIEDLGIILEKSYYEESKLILRVYTRSFGICKFITSLDQKRNNLFQEANMISLRLKKEPKYISVPKIEISKSYGNIIVNDYVKILCIKSLLSHLLNCLPENYKDQDLFDKLINFLDEVIVRDFSFQEYLKMELLLLEKSGYGLSLSSCAVTGSQEDLKYVSPKTGRAVSHSAGQDYKDKLLILPEFILKNSEPIHASEIENAFKLTGYFFDRYIKKQNTNRDALMKLLLIKQLKYLK